MKYRTSSLLLRDYILNSDFKMCKYFIIFIGLLCRVVFTYSPVGGKVLILKRISINYYSIWTMYRNFEIASQIIDNS